MIIFSERKLAQKLSKDELTERQQLHYLAVLTLIDALTGTAVWHHHTPADQLNVYTYISDVFSVIGFIAVTFYAFGINSRGDGRNFIVRYTCLGLPISIKIFIFGPIVSFLMFMLDNLKLVYPLAKAAHDEKEMDVLEKLMVIGPYECVGTVIVILFMAWRYKIALRIASGQSDGSEKLSIPILGSDEGAAAM